jgi:hypothetical protein
MSTETKAKFTAVMVNEKTKDALKVLRDETKLSEKELMEIILDKALLAKDEILAEAAAINEQYEAEKAAKKKERYEALKQAQKEVRAAARIAVKDKQVAAQPIEG